MEDGAEGRDATDEGPEGPTIVDGWADGRAMVEEGPLCWTGVAAAGSLQVAPQADAVDWSFVSMLSAEN